MDKLLLYEPTKLPIVGAVALVAPLAMTIARRTGIIDPRSTATLSLVRVRRQSIGGACATSLRQGTSVFEEDDSMPPLG
jgi:hypothetical protein